MFLHKLLVVLLGEFVVMFVESDAKDLPWKL